MALPDETAGFLSGRGEVLYTVARKGDDPPYLAPWGDFDLRLAGIIHDPARGRSYVVDLVRKGKEHRSHLTRAELGDWRKLKVWLAGYGASVLPPKGDTGGTDYSARLLRYLESQIGTQGCSEYRAAESLGWLSGHGFICHEGVITKDGIRLFNGVMPAPRLLDWAPYFYGFRDEAETRKVLCEVLTFHNETVAAVFGSWWAACFVKPQVIKEMALFPFVAIEAPSESGKTTGMFADLLQLSGNMEGAGQYTGASLRDRVASHHSGIVWVDDVTNMQETLDLLRQATMGGSRTKKGADRTSNERVRLVAPVVVAGEVLGDIETEKALRDRAIRLTVPQVKNRISLKQPDRLQWDDICDLRNRYDGDFTQFAGTVVQMVLREAEQVGDVRQFRTGSGRHADKMAILKYGARLLAGLTGSQRWTDRVDCWVMEQDDTGNENVLTLTMLPRILARRQLPDSAHCEAPAFRDESGIVWMNDRLVADSWRDITRFEHHRQGLYDVASVRAQREQFGPSEPKKFSILAKGGRRKGERDKTVNYRPLPVDISKVVVERTEMQADGAGAGSTGSTPEAPEAPGQRRLSDGHSD